jgi:hypothetical protein
MINILEIKQGNVVKYANNNYWNKEVIGQHVTVDADIYRDIDSNPHLFDPVELSIDLLLKYGFFDHNSEGIDFRIPLPIGNASELFVEIGMGVNRINTCGIQDSDINFIYFEDVQYLHELQNIFQSISRKELAITNL